MLALSTNLYYFSFTDLKHKTSAILSELLKSKLRILSIREFRCGESVLKEMSITSLTIIYCTWNQLSQILKYVLALKYLKIEHLFNYTDINNPLKFSTEKAVRLKQLIINDCKADFEMIEQCLKRTPNLTIFTIKNNTCVNMINADCWQHLIESSLLHLRVFNFYFSYYNGTHSYNNQLKEFQQFQSHFWSKQHHWHTNYEINNGST
ncbi:unnamed protein product [Adineta steineri]|uniref:Uncharacterized protein n=2 Tax=Adineta steineri TaxID=433720 RepID=A0A814LSI3_9BILA|nr:unnamed protein product [Adineta steineri]